MQDSELHSLYLRSEARLPCEILQVELDIEQLHERSQLQYSERHLNMDKLDITDELLEWGSLLLVI